MARKLLGSDYDGDYGGIAKGEWVSGKANAVGQSCSPKLRPQILVST
jgi:hypothetical protein